MHGCIRMWAWMLSARKTDIIRMRAGYGDGMQSSMDVMLWERDGLSMDVIRMWAWMLWEQVAVEHGHKAFCGHGHSGNWTRPNMNII